MQLNMLVARRRIHIRIAHAILSFLWFFLLGKDMVYLKVIIRVQDPAGSFLFMFIQDEDSRLQVPSLQ